MRIPYDLLGVLYNLPFLRVFARSGPKATHNKSDKPNERFLFSTRKKFN